MTITREQVERAIKAAEHGYMDPWISYFGADWRGVVPRYVLAAYGDDSGGWETAAAALTRWRDELAAAEPAEDSPERLRERREALGLSHAVVANMMGMGAHAASVIVCVEPGGSLARDSSGYSKDVRTRYAAALSAAEAERAAKPDHLAYADSPVWDDGPLPATKPERPAPRFKVGDWVRRQPHAGCTEPFCIAKVTPIAVDPPGTAHATYCYAAEGSHAPTLERALEPASPPAPEVVDVPQPIVKRCACPDIHDDVEATWQSGEPYLTVTHTTVPLAILRAMLEAIDAQQGGA